MTKTETWYHLEYSLTGANDWYRASGPTFDSLESANKHKTDITEKHSNFFEYRIVRVETIYTPMTGD
jgi:hypothetical protein